MSSIIAQITQQPQPLQKPQYPSNGGDPVSLLGYVALGLTAVWAVGSQLIAKAGASAIAARDRKINQELSQDAAINEGYVKQADRSFDVLIQLLNTAIGNIFQSSRESKEIFYIQHDLIKKNTEELTRLAYEIQQNSRELERIITIQTDIMNVLHMKVRQSEKPNGATKKDI